MVGKSANGTPPEKIFPTPMLLLLFVRKIRGKARLACTVAKAADIQWSKTLTLCNTACDKLGCSLTSIVLQQSWAIPFYSSMHRKSF